MNPKQVEVDIDEQPPAYDPNWAQNQYPQYGYPQQQPLPPQAYVGPMPPPGYTAITQPTPQAGVVLAQPTYQPTQVVIANVLRNPPPDHITFNIVMTLCCCWPIGVFAIVKSLACRDAINRGDSDRAEKLSREARRLGYWTLGVGIATMIGSIVFVNLYALCMGTLGE